MHSNQAGQSLASKMVDLMNLILDSEKTFSILTFTGHNANPGTGTGADVIAQHLCGVCQRTLLDRTGSAGARPRCALSQGPSSRMFFVLEFLACTVLHPAYRTENSYSRCCFFEPGENRFFVE